MYILHIFFSYLSSLYCVRYSLSLSVCLSVYLSLPPSLFSLLSFSTLSFSTMSFCLSIFLSPLLCHFVCKPLFRFFFLRCPPLCLSVFVSFLCLSVSVSVSVSLSVSASDCLSLPPSLSLSLSLPPFYFISFVDSILLPYFLSPKS